MEEYFGDFWNQQQVDSTERKMRSKIAARRRRQDPQRREREREKNLMAMRRRREDPETREKERERNRIAMRLKRQDPEFREKEKQAMKMRRLTDPEVMEKDKVAHRIRRQSNDAHESEGCRRKHLAMQHFAQHLELAESVGSARFFLSEVTGSDLWNSPLAMEQTRIPRCTDEVEIIPFEHVTIKQEEVESSDSVDMVPSFHEEVDIKEEQEVEMDPSLAATMMSVVLKDDSNASSGDVEELVVEPSLLQFKCFHEDDRQEEDELPTPTMVFVPETDYSEFYLDECGDYENAASESKRLKYALKKSRPGGGGGGVRYAAGGAAAGLCQYDDAAADVFRCPHCFLCLTSSDYLNRHVRRGCRFRDAPIKNAYRCTQCGAGFSNYGELYQHKRRAHNVLQNAYRCLQCGAGFGNYGDLFQHKRKVHDGPRQYAFRCLECGAGFTNYGALFEHKGKVHNDDGPIAPLASAAASSKMIAPSKHPKGFPDLQLCARDRQCSSSSSSSSSSPPFLHLGPEVLVTNVTNASGAVAPPPPAPYFDSGISITPVAPSRPAHRTTGSSRPLRVYPAAAARVNGCRTPDLVFSSSSAVNHFAPVVPDVAANADLPDVAALSSSASPAGDGGGGGGGGGGGLAPDIVSCSRPAAAGGVRHAPGTAAAAAVALSGGDSLPPDVVTVGGGGGAPPPQGDEKRSGDSSADEERGGHVLPSGGGSLVRLNCSAHKRKNPEPASSGR